MVYWQSGVMLNALLIAALLLGASLLLRLPGLRDASIPVSILAGVLGLALGPDLSGVLPLDRGLLESAVYHGLAIVFIAVGLQSPPAGKRGAGATSMAFAIPIMGVTQGLIGLLVVLMIGGGLHPGFGLLTPYGFEEGPGQALSIGTAWEKFGLHDGAQIGLIIAALGFAWAIVVGIPLVAVGRRLGWVSGPTPRTSWREIEDEDEGARPSGTLDVLTAQVVAVGAVYLATYLAMLGLNYALKPLGDVAEMVWGFQFIVGALLAIPARSVVVRLAPINPLDDQLLGRIAAVSVDVVTCAALSAIAIGVFEANWFALLLVTGLAGLATLAISLWVQRRGFPQEPFEHAVVLFGMSTGTLPTGLALLRILDPEMRGVVPTSCVLGSALAIVTSAPLYLFVLLIPVQAWPDGYPDAAWITVGILVAYLAILLGLWRWIGGLRFRRPLASPWPPGEA